MNRCPVDIENRTGTEPAGEKLSSEARLMRARQTIGKTTSSAAAAAPSPEGKARSCSSSVACRRHLPLGAGKARGCLSCGHVLDSPTGREARFGNESMSGGHREPNRDRARRREAVERSETDEVSVPTFFNNAVDMRRFSRYNSVMISSAGFLIPPALCKERL